MTRRTVRFRFDMQLILDSRPQDTGRFFRSPIESCDFFGRPKMRRRVAMAIETPAHTERSHLHHFFHLVHTSMTRNTTHAAGHVSGMIKVGIVGKIMHLGPQHRLPRGRTLADRQQLGALAMHGNCCNSTISVSTRVTLHTGCGRRNRRSSGLFNRVVTIPAIHFQLARMQRVTERDRLLGLIAHINRRWR